MHIWYYVTFMQVSLLIDWLIYPTGQNHSLELIFAKFATAKNIEKFKPTKTCIEYDLDASKHWSMLNLWEMVDPTANHRPPDYKFVALPLIYTDSWNQQKKY